MYVAFSSSLSNLTGYAGGSNTYQRFTLIITLAQREMRLYRQVENLIPRDGVDYTQIRLDFR
jgi:hypothetical protein